MSRLLRSPAAGWLGTASGIALITFIIGRIQSMSHPENVSILYLLVILGSAIVYGPYQSIFAALASVGTYDYFFVDPYGSLDPGDAQTWLEISLFLIVAIVSSQLALQQRHRADEARRREQEATALYTLNSLIVWGDEPIDFVHNVYRAFAADLSLDGLALYAPNHLGKLVEVAVEGDKIRASTDIERAREEFEAVGTPESSRTIGGQWSLDLIARRNGSVRPSTNRAPTRLRFLPILVESRPVGVLEITRPPQAPDLNATQQRFLQVVCQQFGIALDRARLHRDAAEAAALRRSEEVKTAFLNSITHDLRTPLAMIKASAGSLRQREAGWSDAERDGFAGSIERNVDRLDVIVGNLLDISRIDAGMVHPERQYFPLQTLLDDVVGRLGPLLADFSLNVDVPDDLPPVPVDYVAIDRVLSNLIENVTRHTPPGTRITITATEAKEDVVVSVTDNGPGVPPDRLPHLFDRFYRGKATRPDSRRGTGLGLAVVKGLVEAHGGVTRVESVLGQGTTVTFTLPLGPTRRTEAGSEPEWAGASR